MGLAAGIACTILIIFFILDELSYDRYHKHVDNIYRVNTDMTVSDETFKFAVTSYPMAPAFKESFSEIDEIARIVNVFKPIIAYGNNRFYEENFMWADPEIFKIFSYELIKGDPDKALVEPNSVVLTEAMALKYFGNENPLGKVLIYENETDFVVTGVIKNIPKNSTFKFDFLASFSSLETILGQDLLQRWHSFYAIYTFVKLKPNVDPLLLEAKFPEFIATHMGGETLKSLGRSYKISLMPLKDIYLHSDRKAELGQTADITYVYVFSIIAVFILSLACINFMNLSLARSSRRVKEIGLRKVFGAFKQQLIKQFIGESLAISFIALPAAFLLVEAFLPMFNSIADKELDFNFIDDFNLLLIPFLIVIIVGLVSGSYPALFFSRFNTSRAVRGDLKIGNSRNFLRQGLIVFQFTVSLILLIGTATVFKQLNFMQNKKLGVDKEQIIVMKSTHESIDEKYKVFRNRILGNSLIENVASSTFMIGDRLIDIQYRLEGDNYQQKWLITTLPADHDFIPTIGLELIAGRNFSKEFSTDSESAFIINEKAVKTFGFASPKDAIGKNLIRLSGDEDKTGTVIGVVKDFHYRSLAENINAMIIMPSGLWSGGLNYIAVKSSSRNIPSTVDFLESSWNDVFPNVPFRYSFLDDNFYNLYRSEMKLSRIFSIFAALAIFIACLGLLGLVTYLAETKTKEIGIRKVLGSTITNIVHLISREFIKLILIANLIAWPVAYLIMHNWLMDFAYKTELTLFLFVIPGLTTTVIALLTVGFKAVKAAMANPVKALKYE